MTTTTRPGAATVLIRLAFVAAVVVQLVTLYWPRVDVPGDGVPGADKVVHALVFAAVMATGCLAGIPAKWLALVLAGHAVLSEAIQLFLLPDRTGDLLDVVADLAGIAIGWYLVSYGRRHSTIRPRPQP